jgi:peptide deformylase
VKWREARALALREICLERAPVLLATDVPVTQFDDVLGLLIRDIFETMYAAQGRGLAAPQVGVSQRVFVVDIAWKEADPEPMLFVNPRIVGKADGQTDGEEACLSIPGKRFCVSRPDWVEMAWQDLDGAAKSGRFEGLQAVCICHEFDHLNGVLITHSGTQL